MYSSTEVKMNQQATSLRVMTSAIKDAWLQSIRWNSTSTNGMVKTGTGPFQGTGKGALVYMLLHILRQDLRADCDRAENDVLLLLGPRRVRSRTSVI